MVSEFGKKISYHKIISIIALIPFFVVWFLGTDLALAQGKGYPNKPIKIVVPYTPGGVIDLGVRVMADYLARELKVPIIIDNKAGASGLIGSATALKSEPDGYTLLAAGDAVMVTSILQSPNPPFDPFKDFLPVGAYGGVHGAFGVNKLSPIKTLADFIKGAKENPNKLTVGIVPFGGENHMLYEAFRKAAGVTAKLIPYPGTAEGIAALLGQHIDMLSNSYAAFLPYVKSGDVRLLVVGGSVPGSSTPNFGEVGFPQALLPRLHGIFVPIKTPKPIHEKLVLTLKQVVNNPELVKQWEKIGVSPDYKSPAEFTDVIKKKWDTYSILMEELGLRKK